MRVALGPTLRRLCQQYAREHAALQLERYGDSPMPGNVRRSRPSVEISFYARLHESAAAIAFRLDPYTALDWTPRIPDRGFDFTWRALRIDVKGSTHPGATKLLWPKTLAELEAAPIDALVFVRGHLGEPEVVGACSKRRFVRDCHIARGSGGLVPGTPYLESLISIEALLGLVPG